jgi:hypothetical protein
MSEAEKPPEAREPQLRDALLEKLEAISAELARVYRLARGAGRPPRGEAAGEATPPATSGRGSGAPPLPSKDDQRGE